MGARAWFGEGRRRSVAERRLIRDFGRGFGLGFSFVGGEGVREADAVLGAVEEEVGVEGRSVLRRRAVAEKLRPRIVFGIECGWVGRLVGRYLRRLLIVSLWMLMLTFPRR